MTKEEIIKKWETEMDMCNGVSEDEKQHSMFKLRHSLRASAISEMLADIKKLNESTVSEVRACVGCGKEVLDFDSENNNCCDECWLKS